MDKKFLHKVIDQLVSETRIDGDQKRVFIPFAYPVWSVSYRYLHHYPSELRFNFNRHLSSVYGLTEQEIYYVWKKYENTIKDKIKNNGL